MADKQKTYPHFSIQMLEPRIMFDGAAVYTASEAIEAVEDQIQNNSLSESDLSTNLKAITHNNDSRKEIVFIDKGVDDYQTIINSIDDTKSIYLIDSNENGFAKMQSILQDQSDIDAVHIIGHASTGQVVLGNSILNSETINSFSTTLQSIGTSLTKDGDLLFYGCNLAQGEQGKLLIQQIGNITQADIAASDDITGKGGDWDLEKKYGIVETNGISVVDYKHSLLQNGISSLKFSNFCIVFFLAVSVCFFSLSVFIVLKNASGSGFAKRPHASSNFCFIRFAIIGCWARHFSYMV